MGQYRLKPSTTKFFFKTLTTDKVVYILMVFLSRKRHLYTKVEIRNKHSNFNFNLSVYLRNPCLVMYACTLCGLLELYVCTPLSDNSSQDVGFKLV